MRSFRRLIAILVMVLFDAVGFAGCYVLAYVLRLTWFMELFSSLQAPLSFDLFAQRYYLLAVYILVFAYEGLYTKRLVFWEEMRRILRGTVLAALLVTLALYVTGAFLISRLIVLTAMLLALVVLPVARTLAKQLVIALGLWTKTVLVVGSVEKSRILQTELARNWRLGYRVVATIDPSVQNITAEREQQTGLQELLCRHNVEGLILTEGDMKAAELGQLVRSGATPVSELIVLVSSSAIESMGVEIEALESLLLMKHRYNLLQPANILVKRIIELVIAVSLLVLLAPLLLVISLAVKFSSPGPVLFTQERIGRNKQRFGCLKFRTMWQDADERLEKLLAANPDVRAEWERYSRIRNDPRVTPVGRVLRRFSLDELPQLWNVVRGEMSLVGPRPYMPRELEKIGSFVDVITQVRPGITGPFQTSGRKELTFNERLLLDEHYVKNWSLWMDLVLMLRTVRVVFSGRGAL